MDNLVTGSLTNIAHLADNPDFRFIEHDVIQPIEIETRQDAVLHFASPASPTDYQRRPIETLDVGATGTHNALKLALAHEARFLLASTSEVYGDPLIHPQREDYWGNVNPIGPRGAYDEAKRYAEALTMAYHRHLGLETRIARIFNTYGPRMRPDDGRLVPAVIGQALNNQPITVFGDGSQTRSFCYVSDCVEGICRLLGSDHPEPVNIGNAEEVTVLEFANLVKRITGSSSEIVFRPLPQDDPHRRRPDISKAASHLGWRPIVTLEEGLRATVWPASPDLQSREADRSRI